MQIRSGGSKGFCLKEKERTVERAAAQALLAAIAALVLAAAAAQTGMTTWRPCRAVGLFSSLGKTEVQDKKDTTSKQGMQCDRFCNGGSISLSNKKRHSR